MRGVVFAFFVALGALVALPAGAATHPLRTGFGDLRAFTRTEDDGAFVRAAAAGATVVRITVFWRIVAPTGTEVPAHGAEPRKWITPAGFDATNPADPNYTWEAIDRQVTAATAHGLDPLLTVSAAPLWADDGDASARTGRDWRVDPTEFGRFGLALAKRYSGTFAGLPRVHAFEVWNEPNLAVFLNPQTTTPTAGRITKPSTIVSADLYRDLVNSFATAAHSIHADNVVVAGALAPFVARSYTGVGPLAFTRKLLCLSATDPFRPTCTDSVRFDAYSIHPYTSGDPRHHAAHPDDVSLGDLPELRRVLAAGVAAHHVVSNRPLDLWVTEFSWDSKPPDPWGVPMPLLTRWVAECLYRMWQSRVTTLTWFLLRDSQVYQSGLYYRGQSFAEDRPKPTLAAFRFPFVAFASGKRIFVWGRTPAGRPATVLLEQQKGTGWRRLGVLVTDANGIFQARLKPVAAGRLVQARTFAGAAAVPFSLNVPPDYPVNPFGDAPVGRTG